MEIIFIVFIFIALAWACPKLSRYFMQKSIESEQKESQERFYREALLDSVKNIESAFQQEPEQDHSVENLLKANQELIEKRRVQESIEKELGIKL